MNKLPRGPANWPKKVCPQCGVTFGPKPGHGAKDWRVILFCSRACSSKSRGVPIEERMRLYTVRNWDTGCLEWIGYRDLKGYGRIASPDLGEVLAHRIAWRLANGSIPNGLHILHHCDNPRCVEPKHLYAGTNDDNMRDRMERSGPPDIAGERNPNAKLTAAQAAAIRKDARPDDVIAAEYGVSTSTISGIQCGTNWKSAILE